MTAGLSCGRTPPMSMRSISASAFASPSGMEPPKISASHGMMFCTALVMCASESWRASRYFVALTSGLSMLLPCEMPALRTNHEMNLHQDIPARSPPGWKPALHLGRDDHVALHFQAALSKRDQDRKSTRLNSSHLVISYAVFCLKK